MDQQMTQMNSSYIVCHFVNTVDRSQWYEQHRIRNHIFPIAFLFVLSPTVKVIYRI